MKIWLAFLILCSFYITTHGQSIAGDEIQLLYKNGVTLYEQTRIFEAATEFEKVLKIDPNHKDALYYLAIVNGKLDDTATAIRLLQRGMKLNDKRAVILLRDQFHQKISYADTMQNIDENTLRKFSEIKI